MSYNPYATDRRPVRGKRSARGKAETLRRREVRSLKYVELVSDLSSVTR